MEYDVEEIYFLTAEEYAILLAGAEIRECYALQPEPMEMDARKVCLAMNHLYQTGLVNSNGKEFSVKKELAALFAGIRDAEKTIFVRSVRGGEDSICCFQIGGRYVAVTLSKTDRNTYRIYEIEEKQLEELKQLVKLLERGSV